MELIPPPPPPPSQNGNPHATKPTATQKTKDYMKFSFTITYILLLTTGIITFIEAIRTQIPYVRHILNLETCITIVAGYFYGVFIAHIDAYESQGKPVDWNEITQTRYIDWSITTPLMILALCLVLSKNTGTEIHFPSFILIIVLNYIMLFLGFLGEIGTLSRVVADISGFAAFFAMFAAIFYLYVYPKYSRPNYILYFFYLIVWSLYGVVYMFDVYTKNILTNILDLTAKCLIGLGLWIYYTKIIRE